METLNKILDIVIKPLTFVGVRDDLAKHVVVGFVIGNLGMPFVGAWGSLALGGAAAIGREGYNKWGPKAQRTGWSWADIGNTLAGVVLGVSGAATSLLQLLF